MLHAFDFLEKHEGFRVTRLRVDRFGKIDADDLKRAIRPETTLVSIMSANNETGVLQPAREIAAICRERGVLFHCDAVQSFGKSPLDVSELGADAVSLAAHKFYGPKGAGVLWLRAGLPIQKILFGGSQENERRPGTENAAAIAGMARAAEAAVENIFAEQERQKKLRDRLRTGLESAFPAAVFHGNPGDTLANTLNVSFPGLDGEALLIALDLEGICASSGSACMVGSITPSHVLLAMGVPPEIAQATVRFSLGKQTTAGEIEAALEILPRVFSRLAPENAPAFSK